MTDIPYEVKRTTRRNSVRLKIVDGTVRVLIPKTFAKRRVPSVIKENLDWIRQKLAEHQSQLDLAQQGYSSGSNFPYLGSNYRLGFCASLEEMVLLDEANLLIRVANEDNQQEYKEVVSKEVVSRVLSDWYVKQANKELVERTRKYADVVKVQPRSIAVKSYRSRWGSCSINGDIRYNWRLIMAPPEVVDYVVIHELCHILHHNHSKDFWLAVASFCPNYRDRSHWLRQYGFPLLNILS